MGCYNNTNYWVPYQQQEFIAFSSRGREVQDQSAGRFHSWWGHYFWLVDSCLLIVCPHGFSLVYAYGERNSCAFSSSYKGINYIMGAPPLRSHLNLNISQSPTSKYYHVGGQDFNIRILKDTNIPSITSYKRAVTKFKSQGNGQRNEVYLAIIQPVKSNRIKGGQSNLAPRNSITYREA